MTSASPPPPPTVDPPAWQPPPAYGPPARAQLRRSRTDKVLGGVNGGLAEYTGIDALLWRVGFVALTLAAGSGFLVYLLLWVLLPAGDGDPAGDRPTATRTKRPAEPRSPVPGVTLAALLIVLGALVLIEQSTAWDLEPRMFFATALLLVGAGLVAAAFTGGRRARGGLITLGAILCLVVVVVSTDPWPANRPVGDRTFAPSSVADVRDSYEGGVGNLTVDLSDVPLDDLRRPLEISVSHGMGDLEVIVPRSADVRVEVNHGIGEVEVFDSGDQGPRTYPGTGSADWTDDGTLEFELDINGGIGQIEVSRG